MPSALVKVVASDDVGEFLERISPAGLRLNEYEGWIYRGVSSFEHHTLVPSALRGPPKWKAIGLQPNRPKSAEEKRYGHLMVEEALVTRLYKALDAGGLPIPGDQRAIRDLFQRSVGGETLLSTARLEEGLWPPDAILDLLALSQHYRLPTRMLDWTRSALFAAYFSISDLFKGKFKPEGNLAVWALDYGRAIVSCDAFPEARASLKRITVPTAGNPNVNAQRGLFTLMHVGVADYDTSFDRLPLDEQLMALIRVRRVNGRAFQPFVCYTLPRAEAPALAEELEKLGIDVSSIYPGFQGAAESVLHRSALRLLRS